MTSSIESRSAVASTRRTSQPASRSSDAGSASVGRLGRAEHFLALLAAPLARERDAVDERRIDEQRAAAKHGHVTHWITVMVRKAAAWRHAPVMAGDGAAGSGDSSTLQQRRQTGKMPFSTRRRRIST